ncbi:hypothetical protein [Streptomyces sp. A012304]|uniref:hypothetical protein n=1 Tax=Streptomyces sp. A012304 TaxID=375446 RepID=UPI00280352FF|nr:hypothetical protein ALMP_39340 [Streptomyces sp. A012304]
MTHRAFTGHPVSRRRRGVAGRKVLPEPDGFLDAWCADLHDGCAARWIPVERQVEYQARVVLDAFVPAARQGPVGARSGESDWGTRPAVPMHRV